MIEPISEASYAGKMANLNESRLICKATLYYFVPCVIISAAATFFPYPQAFVPVHESQNCTCHFIQSTESHRYIIFDRLSNNVNLTILRVINISMFFGLNWIFLFKNILNIYHVRHIHDRLEIRLEMTVVVIVWLIFSSFQYAWYLFGQIND